jgi:hypothetical protein
VRVSCGKMGNKKNFVAIMKLMFGKKGEKKEMVSSENSGSLSGCGVEIDEVL